jgi:predicted DNA-binding transcriptional regulator AlpA
MQGMFMSRKLLLPEALPEYGIGIGNKQRQRLEAMGRFPKRVRVTERTYGYVEDEIIAYSEERIRQRDSAS